MPELKYSKKEWRDQPDYYVVVAVIYHPKEQTVYILIQANENGDFRAYRYSGIEQIPSHKTVQMIAAQAPALPMEEAVKIFAYQLSLLKK